MLSLDLIRHIGTIHHMQNDKMATKTEMKMAMAMAMAMMADCLVVLDLFLLDYFLAKQRGMCCKRIALSLFFQKEK